MEVIGIIAEYNPFHNGHLYQIEKVKQLYPNAIIIVVLNGYFLERGNISVETKEEKTRLALKYGVDIILELPFVFGSNSADTFASASLEILNAFHITKLVFGSESNDITLLKKIAKKQLESNFDNTLKEQLKKGINYPTAISKSIGISLNTPNDLLAISYIKTILKNNYKIEPISIQRTNDYHDLTSNDSIVSASNIRKKYKEKIDITPYIPEGKLVHINEDLLFTILKYKIITEQDLSIYLTVDEGLDKRLKKVIHTCRNLEELIKEAKTKRYTYNRIMRMFIHILIGFTKEDKKELSHIEYIRLLGFSNIGKEYIHSIKKDASIPIVTKMTSISSKIKKYEISAAQIYELLTNENVMEFENANNPLRKD